MTKIEDWGEKDFFQRSMQTKSGVRTTKVAKTLVAGIRYRPSTIAVLVRFFLQQGERPSNISEVVKLGLECFCDMVLEQFPGLRPESESDAIKFLQSTGILSRPKAENLKRIHGILSSESLGLAKQEPSFISEEDVAKALEKLEQLTSSSVPQQVFHEQMLKGKPSVVEEEKGEE